MTAFARITLHSTQGRRPGSLALVLDQVGHATRELWRSRIVLIFTFLLPLVWLVLIGLMAGNAAVDPASGVRVMQFATPTAAVMGLLFSAYPPVANSLALARQQKITKRLRGTPLPMWVHLVGRIGAAVLLALVSVVAMLGVGAIAYGVQIQWQTAIATVVTLALGVGCLAAMGLAVGALAPSAAMAQTFSMASALVLAFLSGMMTIGLAAPAWMETISSLFPIRPLLVALQDQFNPFLTDVGIKPATLTVLIGWGAAGIVVAAWALRREPGSSAAPAAPTRSVATRTGLRAERPGRPSSIAMVLQQARWATTAARRDAGWVFFAIGMPVALYALMASQVTDGSFRPSGLDFALFFAIGMAVYGAAVTAFINMPEAIAIAREKGLLKRLRGTPLQPWHYLAGRTTSVLAIGLGTGALVCAVGILAFGVVISLDRLPLAIAVFLAGTLTLAACGYALAAVAPSGRAMAVIGLGILLPLSFLSDVFPFGGTMPEPLATIGALFPLRHFVEALTAALRPEGAVVAWADLAVLAAWLVGATLVAVRWFRWEPRR